MPKAIVCIGPTSVNGPTQSSILINYTVSVIGPPNYSYASDYEVITSMSVTNNLIAWRNKIITQAAERGVTLLTSDVIVFGAPS